MRTLQLLVPLALSVSLLFVATGCGHTIDPDRTEPTLRDRASGAASAERALPGPTTSGDRTTARVDRSRSSAASGASAAAATTPRRTTRSVPVLLRPQDVFRREPKKTSKPRAPMPR